MLSTDEKFMKEAIRHRSPDVQRVDIIDNTLVYTHIYDGIVDIKTYTFDGDVCVGAERVFTFPTQMSALRHYRNAVEKAELYDDIELFNNQVKYKLKEAQHKIETKGLPKEQMKEWIRSYAAPYKELMAYYKCAMMEVETKFRVLNEELSLEYDRNPIETIKTRLKSVESIGDKLTALNVPITVESIEQNLHDVAGVRVICGFPSDIYTLANAFLNQDDITLIEKKDYVEIIDNDDIETFYKIAPNHGANTKIIVSN